MTVLTTGSLFKEEYVMPPPKCTTCKKAIVGPRLVIRGLWTCTTCAYYLDRGETPPGTGREG